jgi:outer membrane lipoprotein-sorting protein
MNLRRWLLAAMIFPRISTAQPTAQPGDLMTRIWTGEQQAQAKFTTACGSVTEVRTSRLIVKPLVLHGRFCAEGTDRFMLAYSEPNPMLIRLNENYLNLQGADGKTQVMNIGSDVHRVQSSFSGKNSIESLQKDFTVTVQESALAYEMRLVPRAEALRRRFNYLMVKLNKRDFLPRSLEVDGKSGVNSVFTFDIASVGQKIPEDTFEVVKKK